MRSSEMASGGGARALFAIIAVGAVGAVGWFGCAPPPVPPDLPASDAAAEPAPAATPAPADAPSWDAVLSGSQRSEANKARDTFRHPRETLEFFGVGPSSTVVELSPGGGWYTEILGPYLRAQGRLIVTLPDPNGPPAYSGTQSAAELLARLKADAAVLGPVQTVIEPLEITLGQDGRVSKIVHLPYELAPAGTVDVVVTFRNSHGWFNRGALPLIYGVVFAALKPGGVFGIVQHRAAAGADPAVTSPNGYLPEATIVAAAEAVGFKLADRSEVNANPRDTKDYPNGVWALPPVLRGGDVDRAKYEAIGESDRMTLKFVKPAS